MRDFVALFKGREDAHGKYFSLAGSKPTERGKLTSKAKSVHEAVTPALYQQHLAGKERLGIIPVRADGRVFWFCIDVDFYKIGKKTLAEVQGFEKIEQAIRDCGLHIVVTQSKSGGAHLWCFLEEAMKATEAFEAATEIKRKLNLASILGIDPTEFDKHVDIFPKDFSPDNIGSWVNLPYFGDTCKCWVGGVLVDLAGFIQIANQSLTHPDDLRFKVKEEVKAVKPGGAPPCIDFMLANGVPEGHRNDAVTQFAMYAVRAFPDDWKEKVFEFNLAACQPPMRQDEVNPILKSVGLKGYEGYLCSKIKDIFCDVDACKKREFGVGRGEIDIGIDRIEKIDGEEPIYLVTIGKKTFSVKLIDLYLYANFRKKAMGAINRLIPALKQPEWEELLQEHLQMMEITEAAEDTQMRDRVIKSFQNWCSQSCLTDDLDAAMESNSPFFDGKVIVFSGDAFLSNIDRQLRIERDQAYVYLRGWGSTIVERTVKGEKRKLWCYVVKGPLWFDPYRGKQK